MYGTRKSLAKRLPLGSRVVCALVALALAGLVVNDAAVSQSDPAVVGEWGSLKDWRATETSLDYDLAPVHAVLTHEGKVLFWGFGTCLYTSYDDVTQWDPATGSFTAFDFDDSRMFCGGHAALADGRVLVAGGGCDTANSPFTNEARIYGGSQGPWEVIEPMERVRWYPTVTTLPDGRMLVTSGRDENSDLVPYPELYDPSVSGNPWQSLDQEQLTLPEYPFMFVLPDGDVFFAGPGGAGPSYMHYAFDVDAESWTPVVTPPSDDDQLNSAVMYQPGKIMKAGEGGSQSGGDSYYRGQGYFDTLWCDYPAFSLAWRPVDVK